MTSYLRLVKFYTVNSLISRFRMIAAIMGLRTKFKNVNRSLFNLLFECVTNQKIVSNEREKWDSMVLAPIFYHLQ